MAPCYNTMRSLHYRTQSLPEAVYTNHMLQLAASQDYHHHHAAAAAASHLQATSKHHLGGGGGHHHNPPHHLSAIKKRSAVRRSQTNVCDMINNNTISSHHNRAPLTAGVYEAFLPPPNLNAIGLPAVGGGTGGSGGCSSNLSYPTSRSQSFYVPNHHRSSSLGHHQALHQMTGQHPGHHHSHHHPGPMIGGGGGYPISHTKAMSQRDLVLLNDPKASLSNSSSSNGSTTHPHHHHHPQAWYHRSVPNISVAGPPSSHQSPPSLTTPLFVDCSVEYDLGDHPPVPANSEPLLSIHPEYVVKTRSVNSSPYSMYQAPSNHIRSGKLKGVSPKADHLKSENSHKSLPDIQAGGYGPTGGGSRRLHHASRYAGGVTARRALMPRSSPNVMTKPAPPSRLSDSSTSSLKVDATRKLSVESRDSGICLMASSAGNGGGCAHALWASAAPSSQNCDNTVTAVGGGDAAAVTAATSSSSQCVSTAGQLPQQQQHHQQLDYNNKLLSTNNSKRFAFSGTAIIFY